MARLSARRIALKALRTWQKERRFADSIVSEFLAKAELADSDRAFVLELVYGVLRHLTLLDFWISCLRRSQVDVDLRDVLRLGLYQLFLLKTAPHAAVHETVGLVPQRQRPIVNGMLRSAIRRQSELLAHADGEPLFVRTSHPQFLVERWQQLGPAMTAALLKAEEIYATDPWGEQYPPSSVIRTWARSAGRTRLAPLLRLADAFWWASRQAGEPAPYKQTIASVYKRAIRSAYKDAISLSDLAIDGTDLEKIGITGPAVGTTLRKLLDAVISDPRVNTHDKLLALAKATPATA